MNTPNTPAAPSAAPAGTPAAAVPTSTPAPSAAPRTEPKTLEDYDRLAAESLLAGNPAEPAAPNASGQEPAPGAAATPTEETPVQTNGQEHAGETAEARLATAPLTDEEIHDPTPEELAVLNEPGQRALKAERQARKEARQQVKDLQAQVQDLQAKLTPPPAKTPPTTAETTGQDARATTTTAATATASVATPALADCHTFEAVEARALNAAQVENQVTGLKTQLQRQGHEAVAAQLAQLGVTKLGETPVAEATPEVISDFLDATLAGAKLTQAEAAPRRRFLQQQTDSWAAAVAVVPEINDVNSATHKSIAGIVKANPVLKTFPNWPQIAVKLYLGDQAYSKVTTPVPATAAAKAAAIKPAAATVPAAAKPALRAAPGAPARSSAALPTTNRETELSAKIQSGKATLAEVDEYGKLGVRL